MQGAGPGYGEKLEKIHDIVTLDGKVCLVSGEFVAPICQLLRIYIFSIT
jgi:hypothetical protein